MIKNYVKLKGNLGADPQLRTTKEGKEVASFRIAISERYYDKESEEWKDTPTQWFNAVAFNTYEVNEAKYLKKGSLVNVEGKLRRDKYTDKEGVERVSVDIIVSSLEEIVKRKSEKKEAA